MVAGISQIAFDVGASVGSNILYLGSSNSGTGTPDRITVTEAVAAGDTIIVFFSSTGVGAPADNSLNTYTALNTVLTLIAECYGVLSCAAASAGTLIITPPTTCSGVMYMHYSGVLAFDTITAAQTGSSSVPNPGNITPTHSSETIVVGEFSNTLETAGSSYALRKAGSNLRNTWGGQDYIGAPGGSNSTAFGTSASSWSAIAVTLISK